MKQHRGSHLSPDLDPVPPHRWCVSRDDLILVSTVVLELLSQWDQTGLVTKRVEWNYYADLVLCFLKPSSSPRSVGFRQYTRSLRLRLTPAANTSGTVI